MTLKSSNRETRKERIQTILTNNNIQGTILQVKNIRLNLGPVKCVACGIHIQRKEKVWRIVVKNPHAPVQRPDETLTIRWLDKKEYRLCLNCEPMPGKDAATANMKRMISNEKTV